MKYNKPMTNIQGSLLLIRHMPDDSIYRLKSSALEGLSIGDAGSFGWASFAGKGTYLEPGWPEPIGNHTFLFYVEDHNQPGNGVDKVWVEVRDKDEAVIEAMSMTRPGPGNAVEINGGNIVVPHNGVTDTTTQQVTVSDGSTASEMYIAALDGIATPIGNKWTAAVTITVQDDGDHLVEGADVTGSWSDGASGTSICTTDVNGQCTVIEENINGNQNGVTFTVDAITHATLIYNETLNAITVIVVNEP